MAPAGGFSVTPGHYNAQYDYDFRQKKERVSYAEVRIMPGTSYTKSTERGRVITVISYQAAAGDGNFANFYMDT